MKIVVLLATYNGAAFLTQQIESLIQQTTKIFRIIVRDDGSNDETLLILHRYEKDFPLLFEVHSGAQLGFVGNFLELVKRTPDDTGVAFFCDQDDVWFPNKITLTLEKMTSERPVAVFTRCLVTDSELNATGSSPLHRDFSFGRAVCENIITGCTLAINSQVLGFLRSSHLRSADILAHDWWVFLVASGLGEVRFVEHFTMHYRQHSLNSLGAGSKGLKEILRRVSQFKQGRWEQKRPWVMLEHFQELYGEQLIPENSTLLRRYLNPKGSRFFLLFSVLRRKLIRKGFLNSLVLLLSVLFEQRQIKPHKS